MTVLDWFSIIAMASAILFLFFILVFFIIILKISKEQKGLGKIRTKNKKKKKKIFFQKKKLKKRKSKYIIWSIVFFLFAIGCGSGSYYTIYYQATHLGEDDQKAIVSGYYYVAQTSKKLDQLDDSQETKQELQALSDRMAAFALNKADYRINSEGQNLINKYYDSLKEYGVNLSAKSQLLVTDKSVQEEFKSDLEKIKQNQDKVIKYFQINEQSLEAQKQ